jgi:hypothetical protein
MELAMGSHKSVTGTSYEKAPTPVADYNVTGDISPDAKCNYFAAGTYNGKLYYSRGDGWFIWWNVAGLSWEISQEIGNITGKHWSRDATEIIGSYDPYQGATGTAVVSAGPH